MASVADTSLKEYLRLSARKTKDPVIIDEYDAFLLQLWLFFELRSAAEDYYDKHRYVAKSRYGALPLHWQTIKDVIEHGGPPEQLITRIAKKDFACVDALIKNMRKVLNRVREKVNIGRVQQVDAHCLRWLTRQPGRDAIEKAGSKQQILGVVRIENYNTLENRVFKDFLLRCASLSALYLRTNKRWEGHHTYTSVRRLKNLCEAGLAVEVMESISSLQELPQPNYVLQQDRLYAKIWTSYCQILRQEEVAEKLWQRHDEVADLYYRCINGVTLHCSPRAKYDTPLWFNDVDGKKDLIDNPCWYNELADKDIDEPELPHEEIVIVDFTEPWDKRDTLIYSKAHRNARPYIKNWHRPSYEQEDSTVELPQIFVNHDATALNDFLQSYYGLVRGKRWVVLTPDNWEARWIEQVIKARPNALSRGDVFMMWRSVAAALGVAIKRKFAERDEILVSDGYQVPWRNNILIRFVKEEKTGRILPQRASKRLHGDDTKPDRRFWLEEGIADVSIVNSVLSRKIEVQCVGKTPAGMFPDHGAIPIDRLGQLLKEGALLYVECKNRKEIAYYDELDPLYMVTQNRAEEVEFRTLIKHEECWPGGEVYRTDEKQHGGKLLTGARKVSLNLLEGMMSDTAPLKLLEQDLDAPLKDSSDIFFEAEVIPGQGLATIVFSANFIDEPKQLDLEKMHEVEGLTKAKIEREMKRHFPPVMPYVEASSAAWINVRDSVARIIKTGMVADGSLFAQAQSYWGKIDKDTKKRAARKYGEDREFNENTMSPVDRLKRENVFGNSPTNRYPINNREEWFLDLFKRLSGYYLRNKDKNVLHLLAWTYQYDNADLDFIRKDLFDKYVKYGAKFGEIEYSFFANNMAAGDKRVSRIIDEAMRRIVSNGCGRGELRLLYNLLQFNPSAVKDCDGQLCEDAFYKIVHEYNRYEFFSHTRYGMEWGGGTATQMAGYFLKCLLFLLHRRRVDSSFLVHPNEWQYKTWRWDVGAPAQRGYYPSGYLGEELPCKVYKSESLESHEAMRKSFIEYINGRGTLEGIPAS